MLYAADVACAEKKQLESEQIEQLIGHYWQEVPGAAEGRVFADALVSQVSVDCESIDALIRAASKHWRLERMARVDRNILRLGAHELRRDEEVPRAVIIDEAVELAKRYGAQGSSVFVNGVLDRIADDLNRS